MKPEAIVYTSNTGYTAQYARMLGKKTGLPVYDMTSTAEQPAAGAAVLYLGWLMAGKVQGYAKAAKRYAVQAVCGVGMGATGSQIQDLQKANRFPETLPVFTLQGGFDLNRLHGLYRFMMTVMVKTAGKGLSEKPDRTPDEDAMLDLLLNGGSRVREENLTAVLDWYQREELHVETDREIRI